ncbi:MAG: lytic transglycosylase domain-containing protein [Acidobacteria bacterium]|nr:lytic transglycosylase domain-containing protein [Acidobacteriota bacterium]
MASRIARRHRVDEALVLAVIEVESRYDAFAVSPRGAMGLMQLMPQTAARFAVANAFNPVENVDGGVRYLKELLERYSGQVRLALAAYNAGEQAVDRFGGIPPFRETEQYVVRVTRALAR